MRGHGLSAYNADCRAPRGSGKAHKIQMATIRHWKNGVVDEEYLFWDNQEFTKQIGLGK
jgi:hypothetical protein